MALSAHDYAWFDGDRYGLTVESCLTLVKGLTADEVVRRIGGSEFARMTGLGKFDVHQDRVEDTPDRWLPDGTFNGDASSGRSFAAVTDVHGGALMVERGPALGIWPEVNVPLSRGTELAAVCLTEVNEDTFVWVRDGELLLTFDRFQAAWREGDDPDAQVGIMEQLGFNFSEADDPDDEGYVYDGDAPARAFALAEYVTGVRFTAETLSRAVFRCVSQPELGSR